MEICAQNLQMAFHNEPLWTTCPQHACVPYAAYLSSGVPGWGGAMTLRHHTSRCCPCHPEVQIQLASIEMSGLCPQGLRPLLPIMVAASQGVEGLKLSWDQSEAGAELEHCQDSSVVSPLVNSARMPATTPKSRQWMPTTLEPGVLQGSRGLAVTLVFF